LREPPSRLSDGSVLRQLVDKMLPNAGGQSKAKQQFSWDNLDTSSPNMDTLTENPGTLEKELKEKQRTEQRLTGGGAILGFQDHAFNAALLCIDFTELMETESIQGFNFIRNAVRKAATTLNDELWEKFLTMPFSRIHMLDQEIHTKDFNKVDPAWKQIMTMPKSGKSCIFLHIGSDAPSEVLTKLLTRLGWYGVQINSKNRTGFEDMVQSVELDPGSHKSEDEIKKLMRKREGLVPKPDTFPLVYVNLVFKPGLVESDSEAEEEADEEDELSEVDTPPESAREGSKTDDASLPKKLRSASRRLTSSASSKEAPVLSADAGCGYGKIGVTRTQNIRKRLRCIRNSLAIGLQRLGDKGTLVVCWPGLPFHPVFLFVVNNLRSLFKKVNLVTSDTSGSFEYYILCSNFLREQSENATLGSGGSAMKSFMTGTHRANGVDDVLLWTLTEKSVLTEARIGAGGGGKITQSYDDLWTAFARKLEFLIDELQREEDEDNKLHAVLIKALKSQKASTMFAAEDAAKDKAKKEIPQKAEKVKEKELKKVIKEKGVKNKEQLEKKEDKDAQREAEAEDKSEKKPALEDKKAAAKSQATAVVKPVEAVAKPVEAVEKTAEAVTKPVEAVAKPAESVAKPVEQSSAATLPPKSPKKQVKKSPKKQVTLPPEAPKKQVTLPPESSKKQVRTVAPEDEVAPQENKTEAPQAKVVVAPVPDVDDDDFKFEGDEKVVESSLDRSKDKKKMKKLAPSRSLPNLAGTLGGAPGVAINRGAKIESTGLTLDVMCKQFPLIKYGYRSALDTALW